MQCPRCQAENLPDSLFCEACGATLEAVCPSCGAGNRAAAKFCRKCRAPIGGHAPPPGETTPTVLVPDGERRQLTVLFCDLVGSTEIATRLDAEDWHRISKGYQRAAADAVVRFGGHVDKFLGDGLVCFFGVPHAHEDDAERAVRAGLAIVDAVKGLNAKSEHGVPLHVRVGMHTGTAVVAQGGGAARDVFGDTPNVAARVQAMAEPDTVLITAATHRLVAGSFVVDERGAHALKGIREPVTLYRARQASGARTRLAAGVARGLTPFTGRDQERRLLMDRWELVQDGEGQVVFITGEAGIGKSRLAQQFKEDLGDTPYTWIECGGSPYYQQSPFYPAADLLQQGFAWRGHESAEEKVESIERALTMVNVATAEAVPLIAQLLNLPLPTHYSPSPLSPEQQRKRLMATLGAWMFGVARMQPMVLVVEDLHWIDPSTVELLGLFSEQGATAPLLLLFTARPEFRAPWPLRAHHAQISLNRLSKKLVREMIVRVAAQLIPPGEMLEALATRTDGVPLFVEELTRAVLEAEGATIVTREIPATLQDSLMARLDRLGPAKDVAQIASVIGREFSYELLHAVASLPETELQTSLQRLTDAELVYARGLPPEAAYSFKHGLIQETAYGSLLKSRRRELHQRVAGALAKAGHLAAQPAVLAYHWETAGDAEAAVAAWQQAAEQAQRTAASFEAESHYRRALDVLTMLPDAPARRQLGLSLEVALFMLLIVTRGTGDAAVEEAVTRAGALAEQVADTTQAVLVLAGSWGAAHVRGEHRAAAAVARQMERLAERDGGAVPLVMAHMSIGSSLFHLGDLDASRGHHARVLALFNDDDFRWLPANPQALSLMYLAFEAWLTGRADTALRRAEQLVAAAEQRRVLSDLALAELVLLTLAGLRRESAGMSERARHLLQLCTDHDLPLYLAGAQVLGGWVKVCEEDAAEGIALIRDGLRREQAEGGTRTFIAVHVCLLAEAYARRGGLREALATLDEAFAAIGDEEIWRADLLRVRGDLLLKTTGPEQSMHAEAEAERCYREAVERAHSMGAKAFELRAATGLGRLLHARGRSAEARAVFVPVYGSFTEGFATRDLKDAQALSGAL